MPKEIGRHEVKRLVEQGARLVEVLPAEAYEALHLPGAWSVPLTRMHRDTVSLLSREGSIVVYCHDTQ
jgi:rhodanese-related sulfurtransferase